MTTINKINFSELQPFNHKATVLLSSYFINWLKKDLVTSVRLAGDGSDGGIEFFLQLTTGETWGPGIIGGII